MLPGQVESTRYRGECRLQRFVKCVLLSLDLCTLRCGKRELRREIVDHRVIAAANICGEALSGSVIPALRKASRLERSWSASESTRTPSMSKIKAAGLNAHPMPCSPAAKPTPRTVAHRRTPSVAVRRQSPLRLFPHHARFVALKLLIDYSLLVPVSLQLRPKRVRIAASASGGSRRRIVRHKHLP